MHAQEYRRRYHLEPLVKVLKQEDKVLEQQGRARATVRSTYSSALLAWASQACGRLPGIASQR